MKDRIQKNKFFLMIPFGMILVLDLLIHLTNLAIFHLRKVIILHIPIYHLIQPLLIYIISQLPDPFYEIMLTIECLSHLHDLLSVPHRHHLQLRLHYQNLRYELLFDAVKLFHRRQFLRLD